MGSYYVSSGMGREYITKIEDQIRVLLFCSNHERKVRSMKRMDKMKALFTMVFSVLSSVLGVLYIPVVLLVISNVIDYATGLMATPKRGEKIKSYKSIRGIMKKVCMWLLVVVGVIIDQLIKYAADTVGIAIPFTFLVACIVAIWLICNEIISILENIADIGGPNIPFLSKIVYYIKEQTEDKASDIVPDNKDSEGQ